MWGRIEHGKNVNPDFKPPKGSKVRCRFDAIKWSEGKAPIAGTTFDPDVVDKVWDWKTGSIDKSQMRKMEDILKGSKGRKKVTPIGRRAISSAASGIASAFIAQAVQGAAAIGSSKSFKGFLTSLKEANSRGVTTFGKLVSLDISESGAPGAALFAWDPFYRWASGQVHKMRIAESEGESRSWK